MKIITILFCFTIAACTAIPTAEEFRKAYIEHNRRQVREKILEGMDEGKSGVCLADYLLHEEVKKELIDLGYQLETTREYRDCIYATWRKDNK